MAVSSILLARTLGGREGTHPNQSLVYYRPMRGPPLSDVTAARTPTNMKIGDTQIEFLFFEGSTSFVHISGGVDLMIAAPQNGPDRFQHRVIVIHQQDSSILSGGGLLSGRGECKRGHWLMGQLDGKRRATRRNIPHTDGASMFRDDSVTNAQTKTCSLADWFCRVEGIENAGGVFHARSAVGEFNEEAFSIDSGAHPEIAIGGMLENRIHRVVHHVQKNLLELVRIGRGDGQILG